MANSDKNKGRTRELAPEPELDGRIELQSPWAGRRNYSLNSEIVLRDAYRLLCVIMADEEIARLSDSEQDFLSQVRDQFVEDELIHLLIGTAVMNRAQDDHMGGPRKDKTELSFEQLTHCCGRLIDDVSNEKSKEVDLSLREACNKIIHAEHITAETEPIEGTAFHVLPRAIILRGRQGRKAWQAILNVPNYVRATVANFELR